MTILTTDTHDPGWIDEKCVLDNKTSQDNLIKALICTSQEMYNFVEFIQNNFENSTVTVVLSDHIYPGKLNVDKKNLSTERTLYNRIISNDVSIHRELVTHYDFFPTILNLLGFTFENNRLGLGFSAVRKTDLKHYNNYYENLIKNIQNKSNYYVKFWK